MSKIAIIGIAGESVFLSVDRFGVTGETTVANGFHCELGGKGFNQAVAAAKYGSEVSFLGAAYSKDTKRFTRISEQFGIKAFFVGKQERSPYAVITTDSTGDNQVCVYRGAELEERDVDLFEKEIISSQILLITNETPISVNKLAVDIAKANGVKVVLNPAPSTTLDKNYLSKIDLLTPNEHETGGLDDYQNVIVTLGKKGCFFRETNELFPAAKADFVEDTTGAGDTFNGVLCACIASGDSIKAACQKANAAAAIKVGRKYILESIPTKKEIDEFMERKNG